MGAKNGYILIAEDDEDDRMLLTSAFNEMHENISLVFVEDGIDLLSYLEQVDEGLFDGFPSLLVLDLNMPRKNGKEVLKELQEKTYFGILKIVVFSTTSCESEKSKCLELGIADYFVKPSGYRALLDMVMNFRLLAGIGAMQAG